MNSRKIFKGLFALVCFHSLSSFASSSMDIDDESVRRDPNIPRVESTENLKKRRREGPNEDLDLELSPSKKSKILQIKSMSIALLKGEVPEFGERVKHYKLKNDIDGDVYVESKFVHVAGWTDFIVKSIDGEDVPHPIDGNANVLKSAIIIINHNGRKFAFVFGNGRYLLKREFLEPDFGLKVSLNGSDETQIKSIDSQTVAPNPRSLSMSYRSPVPSRNFMVSSTDQLKGITDLRYSGKGAYVRIKEEIQDINKLPELCTMLDTLYSRPIDEKKYPWATNIISVKDDGLQTKLDEILAKALKTESQVSSWSLLRPWVEDTTAEAENEDTCISYYTLGHSQDEYPALETVFQKLKHKVTKPKTTIELLKKLRVKCFNMQEECCDSWSAYEALTFEAMYKNELYVLNEGRWYKPKQDYAKKVDEYLQTLYSDSQKNTFLEFPHSRKDEEEADYNERAASSSNGKLLLMDRRDIPASATGHSNVEMCDLLAQKYLIHIKCGTDSAPLSHLFGQGSVSAEILKKDRVYRIRAKDKFVRAELLELCRVECKPIFQKIQDDFEVYLKSSEANLTQEGKCHFLLEQYQTSFGLNPNISTTKKGIEDEKKLKKNKSFNEDQILIQYFKKKFLEILRDRFNVICRDLSLDLSLEARDLEIKKQLVNCCRSNLGKIFTPEKEITFPQECEKYQRQFNDSFEVEKFNPENYTIVYGIITDKKKLTDIRSIIPFFSRINLKKHAEYLRELGYGGVLLKMIPIYSSQPILNFPPQQKTSTE